MVAGGVEKPEGYEKGYYVKPTVFANVTNDMTIAREEIFGPVLSILKYDSEEQAIEMANDTEYGLGASIFTKDIEKAQHFAKNIDSGMVFINSSSFSDPNIPYGGSKNSGYGRTSAWEAFYEFSNHKVVASKIN